jgi:hypothetical protein
MYVLGMSSCAPTPSGHAFIQTDFTFCRS